MSLGALVVVTTSKSNRLAMFAFLALWQIFYGILLGVELYTEVADITVWYKFGTMEGKPKQTRFPTSEYGALKMTCKF